MEMLALFDFINVDQVRNWMEVGGYFLLFGLLFSCGLGVPVPEDIPLTLGGFFVAQGKMELGLVAVVAWCGIIGGDCVLYHLGKKYGLNITKVPFIGKHVTRARIEKAERLFERYGIWVVGVGRMFAGIRGAMVVAAGTIRYNFLRFLIADGLAALVSGGLFVALGYWGGKKVGDPKKFMEEVVTPYKHWFFAGVSVVVVLVVAYIWWRSKRHKTLGDVAMEEAEHVGEQQKK
ncbi:MAG: DedA family protein [Planctomycetota bacterium]|nr:DedA family protein [Planctomycetota bacterium]